MNEKAVFGIDLGEAAAKSGLFDIADGMLLEAVRSSFVKYAFPDAQHTRFCM